MTGAYNDSKLCAIHSIIKFLRQRFPSQRIDYVASKASKKQGGYHGRNRDHDNSVVEGAYQGAMACLGRSMARLDTRFFRFHDLPAHHAADLAGVPRAFGGSYSSVHVDAVDAIGRCDRLWLVG
jgi:hypothetical protein